jgi:hypothetical protein
MRADKSGFILGVAQADYSSDNKDAIGEVPVDLNVKFQLEQISTGIQEDLMVDEYEQSVYYERDVERLLEERYND